MFSIRKGQALIKVVQGIDYKCPQCKSSLITSDGLMPVLDEMDVIVCECGYDVSDIMRLMAGTKKKEPPSFWGTGTIAQIETSRDIDATGFIGKRINEMQMYGGVCVINFTDGSCLEIMPRSYKDGEIMNMEYNFTPAERT